MSDSMMKQMDEGSLSKFGSKVIVKSFDGTHNADIFDIAQPLLLDLNPKCVLWHVATNDSPYKTKT